MQITDITTEPIHITVASPALIESANSVDGKTEYVAIIGSPTKPSNPPTTPISN